MDKREAILQAALELFAERGFHGVPVPLIAQKAKVGAGTIYRYFRDKEHLVNELYRLWKMELHQAAKEGITLNQGQPLRAVFLEVVRRLIEFALENKFAYLFLVAHHHAPYLDQETVDLGQQVHREFLELFAWGRDQQLLKDVQPELLLAVVSGVTEGIMKEHWAGRLPLTPQTIDQVCDMCWEAVRR